MSRSGYSDEIDDPLVREFRYYETVPAHGNCCNEACGWRGFISECCQLGAIGPLCPMCREVVKPDEAETAVPAKGAEKNAARYRRFFEAGLPITFMGIEYDDKGSLDAAIDEDLAREGEAS